MIKKNFVVLAIGLIFVSGCATNISPSNSNQDVGSGSKTNDLTSLCDKVKIGDSNVMVLNSIGEADETRAGYWYYYGESEFSKKQKQRDELYSKLDDTSIAKGDIIDDEMKKLHFPAFVVKLDNKVVTEYFYDADHKYSGATGSAYDSWSEKELSKVTVDDAKSYKISYYSDKVKNENICSVLPSGFIYKGTFEDGSIFSSNIQSNIELTDGFGKGSTKNNVKWIGSVGSYSYRFAEKKMGEISKEGVITSWDPEVNFPDGEYTLSENILNDSRFYEQDDDVYYIRYTHTVDGKWSDDYYLCDVVDKEEVIIPSNITVVREAAFKNKKNVYAIRIATNSYSSKQVEIQKNAFAGCTNLRKIYLGSKVYLKSGAFYGCDKDKLTVYCGFASTYLSSKVEDSTLSVCDSQQNRIKFKYATDVDTYLRAPYYGYVEYELNGGENNSQNPTAIELNIEYTLYPPTRTGYTFDGWYRDGKKVETVYTETLDDVVLVARWISVQNKLIVKSNDESKGKVMVTEGSGYSGETIEVQAIPVAGYAFVCWSSDGNVVSKSPIHSFIMPASDYSIIAIFLTEAEGEKQRKIWFGVTPNFAEDRKTVTYGLYPQKNVNDEPLLTALDTLDDSAKGSNGWYLYENEYYAKLSASPDSLSSEFDNGTKIKDGATYWFKCEPITWDILQNGDGGYYLLSSVLLDAHCYHASTSEETINGETIHPNNYEHSSIREWLNGDFYDTAFALGDSYIQTTAVDNSASTTDSSSNPYSCNDTEDKVFLPSYQDYLNSNYGFSTSDDSSTTRECNTTDWARARGALYTTSSLDPYQYNGCYWTRSPYSDDSDYVWCVFANGDLYVYLYLDDNPIEITYAGYSVRPAIAIKIPE